MNRFFGIGTRTPTNAVLSRLRRLYTGPGIKVRTPKNVLEERKSLENVETFENVRDAYFGDPENINRIKLENFILPVFNLTCIDVTDIQGARTIVWEHENGTVYHQDCSTVIPGHPGASIIYQVV